MTIQPDVQLDLAALARWARDRRWLSAATLRRRFGVPADEAARLIGELVAARVLHPWPEGGVYRVRYPIQRRRHKLANQIRNGYT